ncbi:MAG: Trp family transcriptional regulator [bacterium]|nr:Trp family transcriptional regulator [bacterium]
MRVKVSKLSEKEVMATLDALYTAASSVSGRSAVKLFLKDLLTPSERIMLGRRVIIARLLLSGKTYEDIIKRLGVGTDTIYRVQRWLSDQMPGYEKAIEGLEKEFERRRGNSFDKNSALFKLKKKYPLHFLLFPYPKNSRKN